MDEIINCNCDDFLCVMLKLVSGEEIIAHVESESFNNIDDVSLVLHNPFLITLDDGLAIMSLWIISNSDDEQVIDKNDIMVRSAPNSKFEMLYFKLLRNKLNMESEEEDEVMEIEGNIICSGGDSIN